MCAEIEVALQNVVVPALHAAHLPTDKPSLDRFLAKQNMSRSARRDLFRAIGEGTRTAADLDPATLRAGDEPQDLSALLNALTV